MSYSTSKAMTRAVFLNKIEEKHLETRLGQFKKSKDKWLTDMRIKTDKLNDESCIKQESFLPNIQHHTSLISSTELHRSSSLGRINLRVTKDIRATCSNINGVNIFKREKEIF